MWENVIDNNWKKLKSDSWSLKTKRLYLLTLPIAFLIHMFCYLSLVVISIASLVTFAAIIGVIVAPIEFSKALYEKFWLGETDV